MADIKRVALVTGGAGGIGKETAERLLKNGMAVAVADVQKDLGEETANGLSKLGEAAFFHRDLTDEASVDALVNDVVERFGRIDVLVNNAGIPNRSPIGTVTREEYKEMFGIHLDTPFFLSQAAAEHMKKQRWGRIVNISSPRAICPDIVHPLYGIAKAAVRTMTEYFAVSLSRYNIRVNCVSPALIFTPMTEHYRREKSTEFTNLISPPGCYQELSAVIDAIEFLVSDASSSINGQTLETDAGLRFVNALNLRQYEKLGHPKNLHETE